TGPPALVAANCRAENRSRRVNVRYTQLTLLVVQHARTVLHSGANELSTCSILFASVILSALLLGSKDKNQPAITMFWPDSANPILKLDLRRFVQTAGYAGQKTFVSDVVAEPWFRLQLERTFERIMVSSVRGLEPRKSGRAT